VNDRRVESIALGEGDRVRVGTTTLLVEAIAASDSTDSTAHGARDGAPAATSPADASPPGLDNEVDGSPAG
jgi:hypothetical protein